MEYFCGSYAPFCLDPVNVVFNEKTMQYPRINGGVHYRDGQEALMKFTNEFYFLDYISGLTNTQVSCRSQIACNEENIVLLMDHAYTLKQMELVEINLNLLHIRVRNQWQTQNDLYDMYDEINNCKPNRKMDIKIDNDDKNKIKCYLVRPNDEIEDENDNKMAMAIQYLLNHPKKMMQWKEKSDNPANFHTIGIQSVVSTRIGGRRTVRHEHSNRSAEYNEVAVRDDRNTGQFPGISDFSTPTNNSIREIKDNNASNSNDFQNIENIERNLKNSMRSNFLYEENTFLQVIEGSENRENAIEHASLTVSELTPRTSHALFEIDSWPTSDFSEDAKRCLMNGTLRCMVTEDMSSVKMYTVLCIDISESMGDHGINGMKEFVRNFVEGIQEASRRHKVSEALAVTVFGKFTTLMKGWTTNYQNVIEECERLQRCGPSPLALGIYMSIAALSNAGFAARAQIQGDNLNVTRRIILISDGRPTRRTCDLLQVNNDDSCIGDEMDVRLEIADKCVPCLQAKHIPVMAVPTRDTDESEKRFLRKFAEKTNGHYFENVSVASRNLARSLSVKVHTEKLYQRYRSRGLSLDEIEDSMIMSCTGDDEYLDSLRQSLNHRITEGNART